jgi:hypothetical protein
MRQAVIVVFTLIMTTSNLFAETKKTFPLKRTRYSRATITLDENISIEQVINLPQAPDSEPEFLDDQNKVRLEISNDTVNQLMDQGVIIEVEENYLLIESAAIQADVPAAVCSGYYEYRYSNYDSYIQDNTSWYGSGIDFTDIPGEYTVSCIDIHYVIRPSWSFVDVEFSGNNYNDTYALESYVWGGEGDIIETKTGITYFNGDPLSQQWVLWAYEYDADGSGFIDYWWIKLYYEDYCIASSLSNSNEYISSVQLNTINNSSGPSYYSDYTHLSTEIEKSTGYTLTVNSTNGFTTDELGVWIDWNQDMDFDDADETISVSGSPGTGPFTATITPPGTATLGSTRMRLVLVDADYNDLAACGYFWYGEVEDYNVTIIESGPATIRLGGLVHTQSGQPLQGIEVALSSGQTDLSDANGYYEFEVNSPYYGQLSVPNPPESWSFMYPYLPVLTADKLDADILGTYNGDTPIISGYIKTEEGRSLYDVVVTASTGESTTTGSGGYYELELTSLGYPPAPPWSGTVTVEKDYWVFTPPSREYDGLINSITDQNYVAEYTQDTFVTVSGYVKTSQDLPVEGIEVTENQLGCYAITDANGYYE